MLNCNDNKYELQALFVTHLINSDAIRGGNNDVSTSPPLLLGIDIHSTPSKT